MANIIKEILKDLPDKISQAMFEGANIVLYTKEKDFFLNDNRAIKKIVDKLKKRIELRADPAIVMDLELAEKEIRKIIPEESGISSILFDHQRSQVVIEAEKPGLAIGKQGSLLREIREKTLWVPLIKRTPAIKAPHIEDIRSVLYQNSDERRKFLDKVGHRVYDGWIRGKINQWVRVSFLGGGRQVGRSSLLLQTPESRVLLDCGINVAEEGTAAYPHLEAPEVKIDELDAVIITHSHLDHSGFLPYLFKFGYDGPVYCTAPTRDVMALLQLDLIKIMRNEGKEPLYSTDDVKKTVLHTITLEFGEVTDITPDVRLTLYNAGHILGSAEAHLHIGNGLHNLCYSGDIKFGKTPLLEPANVNFPRLETLIIESTYGGRDNVLPPMQEQDKLFKDLIIKTIKKQKGKVLMPVLGSGRAQDLMVILEKMIREGDIPEVPIYIHGMVWDITAIHTAYPEYLNNTIRKQIFHKDQNPFLAPFFKRIGSAKEKQQVIEHEGPCIIMATSGMMVGGPSVDYFKALAENKNNSLIFTCFQPEGSLGQKIRDGQKEFTFPGKDGKPEVVTNNMETFKLEITDHSDRKQLLGFVHHCNPKPRKVIVNHGEASRCLDLAGTIHRQSRIETACPRNLESIRIR